MEKIKNFLIEMSKTDKMAHFGIGGLICALLTFVIMIQDYMFFSEHLFKLLLIPLGVSVVVFAASVFKELVMDSEYSWLDIIAAMIGCLCVFVAITLGLTFYLITA